MLTLTRPLICFDLETTGINPDTDRIWQMGLVKIYPDGRENIWESFFNPGIPIPSEVSIATKSDRFPDGILNEHLINAPPFSSQAPTLAAAFVNCDFAGYNLRKFDIPLLQAEFKRSNVIINLSDGKVIDGLRLYAKVKPRNLANFVETMTGDTTFASKAHDALEDAKATWQALKGLLALYPDIPRTPEAIHEILFGADGNNLAGGAFYFLNGEAVINFGKHRGKPLRQVPIDYLSWVLHPKQSFDREVMVICEAARKGIFPKAPTGPPTTTDKISDD